MENVIAEKSGVLVRSDCFEALVRLSMFLYPKLAPAMVFEKLITEEIIQTFEDGSLSIVCCD